MLVFILVISIPTLICIIFAEDIAQAIWSIFSKTWKKVSEEPSPSASNVVIALLLLTGLCVVARGTYQFALYAFTYTLPLENPTHITLSMIVLSAMMGILLHQVPGLWKLLPASMSACVVIMFGFLAYSQVHQAVVMTGQKFGGNADILAGLQFGLMTLMEIAGCFGLMVTAGSFLGYALFAFMFPLWFLGIIAWLSTLAKKAPSKFFTWKSAYWQHKASIFLEKKLLRDTVREEEITDEPKKTRHMLVKGSCLLLCVAFYHSFLSDSPS